MIIFTYIIVYEIKIYIVLIRYILCLFEFLIIDKHILYLHCKTIYWNDRLSMHVF